MKSIILKSKVIQKVIRSERELSINDVEELPKGLIPGEWIILSDNENKKNYIAYVNPFSENFYKIKILICDYEKKYNEKYNEHEVAQEIIKSHLLLSIERRSFFKDYQEGCRLVFGANDLLPGLIVDKYKKYILIQINTAGIDRFRALVKEVLIKHYPNHRIILFDNAEYRKNELLPVYDEEILGESIEVCENELNYIIPKEVIQKIGYYYDHRENRAKLANLLVRLNISMEKGLDLFCYVGSWGLHLLKANVKHVDFVDQANMNDVVKQNLKINSFSDKGTFVRSDVFKFLDLMIEQNQFYDIVVSDPPAFTKSEKNKLQAIQGYEKLHTKVMKILKNNSIFVVASCTHPVGFDDLNKTVLEAAMKNNISCHLLDLGTQGFDHPMTGLSDKSFYIKYLVYRVKKG